MMKKGLLLTALLLALPFAAFAGSSVDFTNGGGTLSGTNSGLTLTGSTLIAANGLGGGLITGSNLGTVSFSTGALSGGNLQMGGTFAAGGSFSITGNGTGGIPNGVIFNGSFTGPVTWTLVTLANGTHNYTLSGSLTGTWYAGGTIDGATVQLTINTGHGFFSGQITVSSGDTNFTTVPEPGTLSLLGTGLIAVGGVVRRKLRTLRG
ncbi:MAG TPA: PEP-CTERM sorting domain-containing protein [Candidatus Sulfotelmatobacter sp.]|nr:PEP-CTERM sorting domain-containing protein [Candidatus Sulfotelmatobacter sp.]